MVQANNSDLGRILYDIAAVTGTTIHGTIRSIRIYGVYGPRSTRDVLSDLLDGSGYNFMMIGLTPQGAPRDLVLTLKKNGVQSVNTASAVPSSPAGRETTDTEISGEESPDTSAVIPPPPAPPENVQERVDQNLRRLQQMHDLQSPENPPK